MSEVVASSDWPWTTEPLVCFDALGDHLTTAGCDVGVELHDGAPTIVVREADRRVLRAPVERGFDDTATVLVLSGALRQRWGGRDVDHDGWLVQGTWPELEALACAAPA